MKYEKKMTDKEVYERYLKYSDERNTHLTDDERLFIFEVRKRLKYLAENEE